MTALDNLGDGYRFSPELRAAAEAGDLEARRRIRIAAEFGDASAARYLNAPYRWNAESPIERNLLIAISEIALSREIPEAYEDPRDLFLEVDEGWFYRVETQAPIGPYRADILLTSRSDEEVAIVVECDGREWHTSPAQIARDRKRDRYMEALGYTVLRFTGHEIHCMADRCAREVMRVASLLFPAEG